MIGRSYVTDISVAIMLARAPSMLLDPIAGFEVSVKFLQYFSETEILRQFHEIYDFSEIYYSGRQHNSACVQCQVAKKFQILDVPAISVPNT